MQKHELLLGATDVVGYEPAKIPMEKYAKVVQGRNRFLLSCAGFVAAIWGFSMIPQALMFRSLSRIYRTYCSGRVLDLTPKIADTRDVRYYEMSRATRVEFLVEERVIVDDRHYKLDESLSNAEQGERRKAMTLDFMVNNDHNWVGSSVTFGVIERKEMEAPGFSKHDTVVIRNELMNLEEGKAREILSIAAKYVKSNGYVLLMDFGVSSSPLLASFARMLKQVSGSSMHLTHDYRKWISEENLYLVAEERRCLLGCHYAIALQLRL